MFNKKNCATSSLKKTKRESYTERSETQLTALGYEIENVLIRDIIWDYFGISPILLEEVVKKFHQGIKNAQQKYFHAQDNCSDCSNMRKVAPLIIEIALQAKQFAITVAEWCVYYCPDTKIYNNHLKIWMLAEVLNSFFNCQYKTAAAFKPVLGKTIFGVIINWNIYQSLTTPITNNNNNNNNNQSNSQSTEPIIFTTSKLIEIFGFKTNEVVGIDFLEEDLKNPGAVANKARSFARKQANYFHKAVKKSLLSSSS